MKAISCLITLPPDVTGKNWHQTLLFRQGIDTPTAKKVVKLIKDAKLKVQASIQGERTVIENAQYH